MLKKKKLTVLSFALLLALLVAAVMPLSALAQDGTPPQPEVPVVVDEPVADEPAADEPAVEESVVEESSTEEITVSEILEKLPEDTALVVVDEEGEALSLASAEAAEVIVVPDPKFCPGTASFDDPLCGPVRATISEAVADAYAAGGSGTIYVEAGTFTEDVTIDGSLFFGGAPTNLTVWGAGSGVGGTTLNGSFTISNMNAFTLSGFSVNTSGGFNSSIDVADGNGTLQLTDLAVTNANEESIGIRVDNQTGNVNLTGVTSTTMGTGILINVLSGDVTLDDVVVTRNLYDGASVRTEDGNITVNNGDFSNNGYDGGYIDAGNGDITINDGNFSDNGYKGLNLRTAGSGNVSLNKVTATGNGSDGAYVNGDTLFLKTSTLGRK
jgi:hypothetical protein